MRNYRLHAPAHRLLGWASQHNRPRTTRSMLRDGNLWIGPSSETRVPEETSEYWTGLRAAERVSRELTTVLGIQAAGAPVGVLG